MPRVTVNGTEIEVDKGITILQAAAQAGFEVPHFCYHPALSRPANCRMCLVEVEGAPKLLPGCYNPVGDNMVIHTESDRVIRARKAVLEFILVNHPVDCPICDKAGECKLQDYYFAYDAQESRMRADKNRKVKAYPIGPHIVYDGERCILCTRCIRFCEEITGTAELTLVERGDKTEVRTFPGLELDNNYSMCTVDICPVGALTSRDFRFKCRVWLLTSTESVCTGCSKGCNVHLDHFRNEVQRYRPRYNPEVNDYWMCDSGRLTYSTIHEDRLLKPVTNGAETTWHDVAEKFKTKLSKVIDEHGASSVALVLSPQASCEDLYLSKLFFEQVLEGKAQLYTNGNPDGDQDKLLIQADKNPNRRGIEAVFAGLEAKIKPFAQLSQDIASGKVHALHMMDARTPLADDELASFIDSLDELDLFIFQSMQRGPFLDKAHIALPACSHAEKDGTFVNGDGISQPFHQAFMPHGDALPDWQIFMRMARAMGHKLTFTYLNQIQDKMFSALEAKQKAQAEAEAKAAEAAAEAARKQAEAEAQSWEETVSEAIESDESDSSSSPS